MATSIDQSASSIHRQQGTDLLSKAAATTILRAVGIILMILEEEVYLLMIEFTKIMTHIVTQKVIWILTLIWI